MTSNTTPAAKRPTKTWRGNLFRITYDEAKSPSRPWEVYWSGKHHPVDPSEDLVPFKSAYEAMAFLARKGAKPKEMSAVMDEIFQWSLEVSVAEHGA